MACAVLLKHATTTHNWSENCIQSLKVCVNTPAPFSRKDPCFFRQDWSQKENYTPLTGERWRKPLYHALLILLVFRAVFRAASNPRTYPNAPFHVLFRHSSYGHLHHFGGRPFHRSQVLFVFMVLSQQVSLGVPSCCYKTPLPVPQLAHGVERDLRRDLPQQTIKSGDHIRPMKQLPAPT